MKSVLRIIILIVIITSGCQSIIQLRGGYEIDIFEFLQYIAYILLLISTIAAIFIDRSYYRVVKKPTQYIVSFIGVLFVVFVAFKMISRKIIDRSSTVLSVTNMAGANNVLTFDFKEDNNLVLTEYNLFGSVVYYGKYNKVGDSLNILGYNYDGGIEKLPKYGLIKNDTVYWNNFDTMVIDK
jgi:amino acid transporter